MKSLKLFAAALGLTLLAGCATPFPIGTFYTNTNLPVTVTSNTGTADKVGKAVCNSVLGIASWGDCSIDAAKKAGSISEVHHVDWKANNILGIYGTYELTVYGR